MTLYSFLNLNSNEQASLVWDNGSFLASRDDDELGYALYALGDFFVEICFSNNNTYTPTFTPFRSIKMLEPYWQVIELPELEDLL